MPFAIKTNLGWQWKIIQMPDHTAFSNVKTEKGQEGRRVTQWSIKIALTRRPPTPKNPKSNHFSQHAKQWSANSNELQKSFARLLQFNNFQCRAINLTLATPMPLLSLRRLSRDPELMQFPRIRINFNLCLTLTRGHRTRTLARAFPILLYFYTIFTFACFLFYPTSAWPMPNGQWPGANPRSASVAPQGSRKCENVDWLDGTSSFPTKDLFGVGAE